MAKKLLTLLQVYGIILMAAMGHAQGMDHTLWDGLLQRHVSQTGRVDYVGFKTDSIELLQYLDTLTAHLEQVNSWDKPQQLAFWINAYNACTVNLICSNWPVESIKDLSRPWKQIVLKSKNSALSLDAIEHEILRQLEEPRIHFAINCASESCPKLANRAYDGQHLEEQLKQATIDFLSDASKNNCTPERLYLSRIFLWFKRDFGRTKDLIDLINQHTGKSFSEKIAISYLPYDWSLNQ
jgi:hypothetical protein